MMELPRVLPVAPLIPWIKECCEKETVGAFAERCGVSAKRIANYISGRNAKITFNALDKMISTEGSRSIIDFYPEYDDDQAFAECGNKVATVGKKENDKGCSIEDCNKAHHSGGFCNAHYSADKRARQKTLSA